MAHAIRRNKTMHLLFSPELANIYYIGGGGLGLVLIIVIVVLLLR
jgi:cellobiose-specific phosphotransferase system component IIC